MPPPGHVRRPRAWWTGSSAGPTRPAPRYTRPERPAAPRRGAGPGPRASRPAPTTQTRPAAHRRYPSPRPRAPGPTPPWPAQPGPVGDRPAQSGQEESPGRIPPPAPPAVQSPSIVVALSKHGAVDGQGGHAPRVRGLARAIFSSIPLRFQGRSHADNRTRLLGATTKEALLSSAVHPVA